MKAFKRILLVLGILVGAGVVLLLVALIPSVQKALVLHFAQQPGTKLEAEGISAGFGGADASKVRYEMPGVVVSLDSARVDTSLLGLLFGNRLEVQDVKAQGIVVDLTPPAGPPPPTPTTTEPVAPRGFLALASLPRALVVGKLALDGKLILPDAGGSRTATFTMTSAGIAPDAESTINCTINLPASPGAASGETKIALKLRQSADGKITGVSVVANVQATVPEQPPVALTAFADLRADDGHETWSVRVVPQDAKDAVVDANGTFDPATQSFTGAVKLAVAASVLAPWLPADLPVGSVNGEAALSLNLNTLDWNVRGAFDGSATDLAKLDERLTALEPVKVHTDLAAQSTGGAIQAEKYTTTVFANNNQPLLEARLLRPIAINADGLPDQASLEGGPLAQVALSGIPLSLAQPFLPEGMTLTGGAVTGTFNVAAQGDAFVLDSTQPLTIANLHAALPDMPFVAGSDLTARLRARLDLAANRATCESLALDLAPTAGAKHPTPSLALTLEQPVVFDLNAGAPVLTATGGTLAQIDFRSVPLRFVQPYLPESLTLSGDAIAGALSITTADGAYVFQTTQPLKLPRLAAAFDGTTYVADQDLSLLTRMRWDSAADRFAIETLEATLNPSAAAPALRVELAQPMAFDLAKGEMIPARGNTDFFRATFDQFPVPDLGAFLTDVKISPEPRLSGGLAVKSTTTGWTFVTTQPLALTPTSIAHAGDPMLESTGITTSFNAQLDGDVLKLAKGSLELQSGGGRALLAEFSGETNFATFVVPKFTLQASGDLARLLAEPVLRGKATVTGGTFALNLDGAVAPAITAKGRVTLDNLAAPALGTQRGKVAADLDVKASADFLTLEATNTMQVTVGTRASNLTASVRTTEQKGRVGFEGKVASPSFNVDDLMAFLTAAGTPASTATPAGPTPAAAPSPPDIIPFWSAYHGTFTADIKQAVYQGNNLSDIVARLSVEPEAITIQQAGFKLAGGPIAAKGSLRFTEARAASPYFVAGEAKGTNVDTAALFKMLQPNDPPMVATIANFDATISGTAPNLAGLADNVNTKITVNGTKGQTRIFAAKSELVSTVGKLTSGIGGLIGLLGNRNGSGDSGNNLVTQAQQIGQLLEFLGGTPFDQCDFEATSEGFSQFTISKLDFKGPLIDVAGKGSARVPAGGSFRSLAFQLELSRFGGGGYVGDLLQKFSDVTPVKEGDKFTYLAKPVPLSGDLSHTDSTSLVRFLVAKASPLLGLR